jgi:hypothetical protein
VSRVESDVSKPNAPQAVARAVPCGTVHSSFGTVTTFLRTADVDMFSPHPKRKVSMSTWHRTNIDDLIILVLFRICSVY